MMAPSLRKGVEAVGEVDAPMSSGNSLASSPSSASAPSSWSRLLLHARRAVRLWIVGFGEACRIDRAFALCKRSRKVYTKTIQIFVLNGCIFLGSVWFLQQALLPGLLRLTSWIRGSESVDSVLWGLLQSMGVMACYVFWLYPIYVVTFVLNCVWYNDVAKHAYRALDRDGAQVQKSTSVQLKNDSTDVQSVMLQIGEQIYSMIMLTVFFVEIFAVSYVPYVGQWLSLVLLSWLYAYYCFDYKWGFARWSLERRLLFFETNWAFFAGFGSPCVLPTVFLSPLIGAGVMNVLFPVFVLVATALNTEEVVKKCPTSTALPSRLPIFDIPNLLIGPMIRFWQSRGLSRTPPSSNRRSGGG